MDTEDLAATIEAMEAGALVRAKVDSLINILARVVKGESIMGLDETLHAAAVDLREAVGALGNKVDAAIARLSDNPTAEGVAAALSELQAASADAQAIGPRIDNIDPDVPTEGGVVGDGEGGVTEPV